MMKAKYEMFKALYEQGFEFKKQLEAFLGSLSEVLSEMLKPDDLVIANKLVLLWPCDHRPALIRSPYGHERKTFTHEGIDIVAPTGSIVRAPVTGKVFQAAEWGAYGKRVAIRTTVDNQPYEVYLAHLSRIDVKEKQAIEAGEPVGLSGYTGNVYPAGPQGAHLHLTLRDPSDPRQLRGIKSSFNGCIDPRPHLIFPED